VGRAAYKLAGDNLELAGGLYAVQNQLKQKIHIGARTALEMKGYGHYLGPGIREVFMFGQPGENMNGRLIITTQRQIYFPIICFRHLQNQNTKISI
jgi:hypothetical protein